MILDPDFIPPENFDYIQNSFKQWLSDQNKKFFILIGKRGVGKTKTAKQLIGHNSIKINLARAESLRHALYLIPRPWFRVSFVLTVIATLFLFYLLISFLIESLPLNLPKHFDQTKIVFSILPIILSIFIFDLKETVASFYLKTIFCKNLIHFEDYDRSSLQKEHLLSFLIYLSGFNNKYVLEISHLNKDQEIFYKTELEKVGVTVVEILGDVDTNAKLALFDKSYPFDLGQNLNDWIKYLTARDIVSIKEEIDLLGYKDSLRIKEYFSRSFKCLFNRLTEIYKEEKMDHFIKNDRLENLYSTNSFSDATLKSCSRVFGSFLNSFQKKPIYNGKSRVINININEILNKHSTNKFFKNFCHTYDLKAEAEKK